MADQKIVTETALQAIASDIKDALNAKANSSEVEDIRIGADGTTYPSAGDAVREQFNALEMVTNRITFTESDGYIDSDGTIRSPGATTKEKYTSLIPVETFDVLGFIQHHITNHSLWISYALYDANQDFISRTNLVYNQDLSEYKATVRITNTSAAYISFTYRTYDDATTLVYNAYADKVISDLGDIADLDTDNKTSAVDAINELKGNIDNIDTYIDDASLLDLTTSAGYLTSSGTIGAQDPTALEVYTQKIKVSEGDTIYIDQSLPNNQTLWIAYGSYDNNGAWIERTTVYNANAKKYSGSITIESGISSVSFTYRTYGTATTNIKLVVNSANIVKSTELAALNNKINANIPYLLKNPIFAPLKVGFTMHRGLSHEAPENTAPSFILAGQHGAWGIETDIQETSDGKFYCFHDDTVDRMTDGSGTFASMTSTQINALTIDSGYHVEDYPNLKIPTFADYLAICKKYGCVPVIEIKTITNYDNFIEEIRNFGLLDACILIAANISKINRVRAEGCKSLAAWVRPIGYSYSDALTAVLAIENCTLDLELPDAQLTAEAIATLHEHNIPVMVYTCDSTSTADDLIAIGVDNITSNTITKLN